MVASRAALSAGSNVAVRLRGLLGLARSAIGVEDREALVEGLSVLAEEYEEDSWSDSDSADEDE